MELGNWAFGNSRGEFPVDRNWQDMFVQHLLDMGFDGYGIWENPELEKFIVDVPSKIGQSMKRFENDVFTLMPYYWGEDETIAKLPNFIYKPTGFELCWYKYPLRDSYMNQQISYQELDDIMKKCKESINKIKEEKSDM